ncbi:hypothetical protein NON00_08240 [Roseomonas sp. GC11]|uniref:hypothetical protein n=1 Tax=Roseomonas sp. GC11 TaxID=2950546 RepID=UPI002108A5F9|nr:hypothetical protein [Roseomonas sp. GC11]MCQ4159917.1 hypothetical protein [Roseomonas sp. GC11]
MASALRWLAAREGAPRDAAPLRERLSAIAASQGVFLPAPRASEGDLAEIMARLAPGSTLPPELAPVLAALLQPLFSLRPEPRSPAR